MGFSQSVGYSEELEEERVRINYRRDKLSSHQWTNMLEDEMKFVFKKEWFRLPNDTINGPIARASACKLRNIPKIIPFSPGRPSN